MDGDGCLVAFFYSLCCIWYASFQHMRPKGFLMSTRSIRYVWKLIISECVNFSDFIWFICRYAMRSGDVLACVYCVSLTCLLTSKRVAENEIYTHIIEATDAWAEMFWLKSAIKKQCFTTSQINDNHIGKKTNLTVPAARKYMNGEVKRYPHNIWIGIIPPKCFWP